LPDNDPLDQVREDMQEIRDLLGAHGAADRAASVILKDLHDILA